MPPVDRLQGLHHCFLGWRTSSRLQLLEVCEPLSQRQSAAVSSCGKGRAWQTSREVLPCAKLCSQGSLCATPSGSRSLTTGLRQGGAVTSCRRCVSRSRAQAVGLLRVSRQIRWLSQNFPHKFCLKLWADHVRPRPQLDRGPVLPRSGWRQTSRSCRSWHSREFDSRNVWLTTSTQHSSQELRRRVFGLGCDLSLFFGQRWNCRVCLSLSSERGSEWIHPGSSSR